MQPKPGGPPGPGGAPGGLPAAQAPKPPALPHDEMDAAIDDFDEAAAKDNAVAGPDGMQLERLLDSSRKAGIAALSEVGKSAMTRFIGGGGKGKSFFDEGELKKLADALAATNGTAELLGRAGIRRKLEAARKHAERFADGINIMTVPAEKPRRFSEEPTDFSCFDDEPDTAEHRKIKPMAPEAALSYFRAKVPAIGVTPDAFYQATGQHAFTMARMVDETLLGKAHDLITAKLETGRGISTALKEIDDILAEAGISHANPQYSDMVVRTNMMGSYNRGAMQEMRAPGVAEEFPVWQYMGIEDGRQREGHFVHFDQYFGNATDFEEVRDAATEGEFSGFNCRCTPQPIFKDDWQAAQAEGATLGKFSEKFGGEGSGIRGHTTPTQAATGRIAAFKAGLAKLPAAAAAPLLKAKAALGGITKKVYGKLEARYGKKTAVACMASGQVLGWGSMGVGAAFGVPLVLPGASLWGSLPAVALAEAFHQVKGAFGRHDEEPDVAALTRQMMEDIKAQWLAWLKENRADLLPAKEPDKFGGPGSGRHAGAPHEQVEAITNELGKKNMGYADLADVRDQLGHMSRDEQDKAIKDAWRSGKISMAGYEGRGGLSPRQQAATLEHGGEKLGFAIAR